jgi:probable phosphoglycerate mutase
MVNLNERGQHQVAAMAELFRDVPIDMALCSPLPRTRQTGEAILGDRDVQLDVVEDLQEIRPMTGEATGGYDILSDVAFSHWRAHEAEATFLGGERYHDFYTRVSSAMNTILADPSWHNLAVFAHGGTNVAVLGWATGVGLAAFGLLDQATCCLNIIDFDVDDSGRVLRKTVRGMNITAHDPVMRRRDAGDMELLARQLLRQQS